MTRAFDIDPEKVDDILQQPALLNEFECIKSLVKVGKVLTLLCIADYKRCVHGA